MNYTAARFEVCEERFEIFYAKLRESKWLVKLQRSLVKLENLILCRKIYPIFQLNLQIGTCRYIYVLLRCAKTIKAHAMARAACPSKSGASTDNRMINASIL